MPTGACVRTGIGFRHRKVCLLFSVGLTSVWAWGFLSPFYAIFVSNFYHGLQYFGVVWAMENKNLQSSFRLRALPGGHWVTFTLFCLTLTGAGIAYHLYGNSAVRWGAAFFIVITLMHFWYDSFVWSAHKMHQDGR